MIEMKERVAGTPNLWRWHLFGAGWCPGCHYPIIQRLVGEVLEELDIGGDTIGIGGGGCGFMFFLSLDVDSALPAHGRGQDVATAIKRLHPDRFVVSIGGDGDIAAIGTECNIQAAARGERITVLMVNNGGYAMTRGQMAPTTLLGQVTTTTPEGREPRLHGYPIDVPKLLLSLRGVVYCARGAVNSPANYQRTKKYIKTAFQKQIDDVGYSFVEILSACPTEWHLTPVESLGWIEKTMVPAFPVGEFKNLDRIE